MVTSRCPSKVKISEGTAHQVGRDSTGYTATHQEMRALRLKSKCKICKFQQAKKTLTSLLNREDVTSLMRLISPDSRKFTMHQKRDLSTQTRLKKARDVTSSTLRTSRCQLSNLTSLIQMRRITQLRWKKYAKTMQASLPRSWTSKLGTAYFHHLLVCRCASECSSEHLSVMTPRFLRRILLWTENAWRTSFPPKDSWVLHIVLI